ncbi:MAG: hypothetical protein Q9217_002360 [Psora testacea]
MSHYISSFLIDPVIRHARRFSRPYFGVSEQADHRNGLATAAPAAQEEQPHQPHNLVTGNGGETIFGDPEVVTPTSFNALDEEGDWHADSENTERLHLVELDSLEPTVSARQYTLQRVSDTSYNPHHGLSGSFRSNVSSLDGSSRSLRDILSLTDGQSHSSSARTEGDQDETRDQRAGIGDKILPEDDGMSYMRRRILAIQRTDSSNAAKARMVHGLMTEKHNASQPSFHDRAHTPISIQSSDRPFTPSSPKSTDSLPQTVSPPTSSSSDGHNANPFHLAPEDLKPTYYEKPSSLPKDPDHGRRSSESEEETRALGCAHYKRNIKLQCSACSRWYTCRFCHDVVEDHMLNRKETKNMLCMLCGCAQPASEECALCSERGAWYYCHVCKLWDDDPQKSIYHCNDCGICRVGQGLGKDFFHCKTCCVCMSISIRDTHRCIERSTDCDCPICGEYMFTSPQTVVFMRCGHSIHHRCYNEHMKNSYRCPICSRSIVNMEWQFSRLERAIEAQPMPEEFRDTKAWVYCNDCSAKTLVKYHWLGSKCAVYIYPSLTHGDKLADRALRRCDSYNSAQLSLLTGPSRSLSPACPSSPISPLTQASPSRPPSRGRSRHQSFSYLQPRAASSLPPPASYSRTLNPFSASLAFPQPRRGTHSVSPITPSSFPFSRSPSISDTNGSMASYDDDNEEEEYSDVDFWGGESPRLLSKSPPERPEHHMALDEVEEDETEEESEEEDDDQDMLDDEGEEGDDLDQMEIFGHR